MQKPSDDTGEIIAAFLAGAKEPAIVEPGQEPIPLTPGCYHVEGTTDRVYLEAWTRDRTLSRRITGVLAVKRGLVQLSTERFGKRAGVLELIDLAAPKAQQAYMPQYHQPELREAAALDTQADAAFEAGSSDGETSDKYIRTTVFLASVLFIVGISTHFPLRGIRYGLVGLGGGMLVLSLVLLTQLPGPPT